MKKPWKEVEVDKDGGEGGEENEEWNNERKEKEANEER